MLGGVISSGIGLSRQIGLGWVLPINVSSILYELNRSRLV